jgi:hypothetical protein
MASPNGSHATNLAIQVNQSYAIEASGKCQIKEEDSTSVNMELDGFGPRPTTFPAAAGSIANTKNMNVLRLGSGFRRAWPLTIAAASSLERD